MTSHDESMRAEFETWALSKRFRVGKMANEYLSNQVMSMWEAWRTAMAKVTSGEIMVSDEDAEAIIEAVYGGEFNSDYSRTKEVREALLLRLNAAARAQAASGDPVAWASQRDIDRLIENAKASTGADSDLIGYMHAKGEPDGPYGDKNVPLYTQPPAPSVSVEIDMHWRPLLECMLGVIDEMNDGPMTADQWGEDAALYDQARALIAASKKV